MRDSKPRTASIGLQGAGAYGAFTWGVLDRLLDEEDLVIDCLTGSSSGAINAAALADGYAHGGGRRGAQQALRRFWTGLATAATFSPMRRTLLDHLVGGWTMETSPAYHGLEMAGVLAGPVFEIPFTQNPLRILLSTLIDFDRVRAADTIPVFIAATNVRTGKGRIFPREEITVQSLLASACLPTVFAAVEVEGESYWDGSYVANPPLAPMLDRGAGDVIVVQNNPISRSTMPRNMADISNRANEIAFSISFVRELAMLKHGLDALDEQEGAPAHENRSRLHLISGNDMFSEYRMSSKFNAELDFVTHLHGRGVEAADQWLRTDAGQLGVRSTLDLERAFA